MVFHRRDSHRRRRPQHNRTTHRTTANPQARNKQPTSHKNHTEKPTTRTHNSTTSQTLRTHSHTQVQQDQDQTNTNTCHAQTNITQRHHRSPGSRTPSHVLTLDHPLTYKYSSAPASSSQPPDQVTQSTHYSTYFTGRIADTKQAPA